MSQEWVARILPDLDALKAVDLRPRVVDVGGQQVTGHVCKIHGASEHRHEIAAPISDQGLAAFEAQPGDRLPEEFREWITTVTDGGAGPMHGVIPLNVEPEGMPIDCRADSPFTSDKPCPSAGDDVDFWQPIARRLHQGIAFLADEVDAPYNVLVLRGPAAGQVWWLNYEYAVRPQLDRERFRTACRGRIRSRSSDGAADPLPIIGRHRGSSPARAMALARGPEWMKNDRVRGSRHASIFG